MKVRIRVGGWIDGRLEFDESMDVDEQELEEVALTHIERLANHPLHMLEIEFLDEPDQNARFFRMGTDSRQMVDPVRLEIAQ